MSDRVFAEVTEYPLDTEKYVQLVGDPGAGAIATFTGVTRDTFQGKRVKKLEYEAYAPMAVRKLQVTRVSRQGWRARCAPSAQAAWPPLARRRCAVQPPRGGISSRWRWHTGPGWSTWGRRASLSPCRRRTAARR